MSVAVAASGPLILTAPSSTNLEDADLDAPSSDASHVLEGAGTASPGFALPTVVELAGSAVAAPAHDLVFFDRVHVIPREKDVGAVLSDVEIPVEVWNAFMAKAQSLGAITIEGPAGVEVDDPYGLPTHYPASDSKAYTVRVLAEGGARVDNLVTWVFVAIDPEGTNLHLLGLRMLPFAAAPDMSDAIQEGYGYLGDLLGPADDGTEQRRSLRDIPHGWIEATFTGIGKCDPRLLEAMLQGWTHRPFGVPWMPYRNRLLTALAGGETSIAVDTAYVPWTVGMLAFLWRDEQTWDVAKVTAIHALSLDVELPISGAWPATKTLVIPIVTGFIAPEQTFSWLSLMAGRVRVRFTVPAWKT